MSVVFDKSSFMRHLERDGTFARPQAEQLSEAFHQAVQETVATRADIQRLELRTDGMETGFDAKLATMDARIDGMDTKLTSMEARLEARLDAILASMKVWFAGGLVALSAIRVFAH